VLNDWRCPSKVNCSEAGNATVVIDVWLTGLEPTRFELNINPPRNQDVIYGAYQIRLLKLDPYPETIDQTIPLEDYRATFVVNPSTPTPMAEATIAPTPVVTSVETDDGPPLEAENHYHKGLTYLAAGLTDEAIASFTEAITLYPTYAEAYQFRGDAYRQLRRYDLARADYQQVLALNPEPEIQATVTAVLQEIAQAKPVLPTATVTPTPAPATPLPSPPVKITLDEPFTLKINQRGELVSAGLTIEFSAVIEDSRCPRQVNCAWAGQARIIIYAWLTGVEPTAFELNTNPSLNQNGIPYDAYQIRLLSLDPYPETPEPKIPLEDYRATFEVSRR
jgi:tetratricopeptide (TPR) repeat protein